MTRARSWGRVVPLFALLTACGTFFFVPEPPPPCSSDSDCVAGAICFPEGCGDPGKGIKVQVIHGYAAREYSIDQLSATFDKELSSPQTISGYISQATDGGSAPYSGSVTIRASGSALLLAGVPRLREPTLMPSLGQYQVVLDTGSYTSVVAVPADRNIPPMYLGGRVVNPGDKVTANITFPLASSLARIAGRLLLTAPSTPVNAPMEVQVLDGIGRPVTQRQPVDPTTGNFVLLVPTAATLGGQIQVLASPKDGVQPVGAIIPNQVFYVDTTMGPVTLVMGAFGSQVTVSGAVLGFDGTPVAGAAVYVSGTAEGGGTFKSSVVLTGAAGDFSVKSLPSPLSAAALSVWVVPPLSSNSGILQHDLVVGTIGNTGVTLTCPQRVPVHGRVLRPDGTTAAGVEVRAEVIGAVDTQPLPPGGISVFTDANGEFNFAADPAIYRLDFLPPDQLPRVSRWLEVRASSQPGPGVVDVPEFTLWNGRTVEGTITGLPTPNATTAIPLQNAAVEFYRVVTEGGNPVSYRLATGTTDLNGHYQVVMPTAPDGGT